MTLRKKKGTLKMKLDIVRAWKDEAYRQQLSSEEQALLPANPAGELELSDAELQAVHGAHHSGGFININNNNSIGVCAQSVACISLASQCIKIF
jgi:mersacidin/lichenicidin family type 2 lantibiotic